MANTTIKTRILLRNDTLANWTNSQLVLAKGEVAIATLDGGALAEVRVGNKTTWANSLKLNVNADQISGLVDTIKGTAKKYQVVSNGTNSWKLQEAALSGGAWTDCSGSFIFSSREADAFSGTLQDCPMSLFPSTSR